MSSANPGRFSANIPEAPEESRNQDWERLVAQLEENLQELKEFLKNKSRPTETEKEPESHVYLTRLGDTERAGSQPKRKSEVNALPHNWVKFAVTPVEAEAILERVGKYDQESQIMERLAKVERQNRRLTVLGFIYFTLMVVFMLVAAFLWLQLYTTGGPGLRLAQAPPPQASAPEAAPPQTTPAPPLATASPAATTSEAGTPDLPSPNPATSAIGKDSAAGEKGSAAQADTTASQEASAVKFVGSVTSNKYHYPDCKWAKTIIPSKLRVFSSVTEAQKAGYIPCPACKPPKADEPSPKAASRP